MMLKISIVLVLFTVTVSCNKISDMDTWMKVIKEHLPGRKEGEKLLDGLEDCLEFKCFHSFVYLRILFKYHLILSMNITFVLSEANLHLHHTDRFIGLLKSKNIRT